MWEFTFALCLIIIGMWFRWRRKKLSFFKELGIPGPEPHIIFGNAREISKKTALNCHKEWIEKYGKVVGYYFGLTPTLIVADVELMKKILISDFHKFSNRPEVIRTNRKPKKTDRFTQNLTALRDKRWKEIRSIISPSFTTSKMRMMLPIMDSAVDDLLEILEKKSRSGDSFDIYKLYQSLTMDVIGRTAFGVKTNCQNNPDDILLKASKALFSTNYFNSFILLAISFPELGTLWKYLAKFLRSLGHQGGNPMVDLSDIVNSVLKDRRQQKLSTRPDLLQIMMDAGISESELSKVTDDQLTATEEGTEQQKKSDIASSATKSTKQLRYMLDQEIVDNAILFFLAGYETTSTGLAFATHFLVNRQDVQDKVREELKGVIKKEGKLDYSSVQQLQYLDQVFTESLRIYPPVYLFVTREASTDVQYGSYKIPKGLAVEIPVYNLHHDPELWQEPEKFDPERFSLENKGKHSSVAFQAFGAGPRNCIGMRFAQLEAKLALARMLNKYKLLPTETTEKDTVELNISLTALKPAKGINLKIVPV